VAGVELSFIFFPSFLFWRMGAGGAGREYLLHRLPQPAATSAGSHVLGPQPQIVKNSLLGLGVG